MLAWIIEASIRSRFLVLLLCAIGVAAGGYVMYHIPVDALPDVSDVQVIVFTQWPGQAPQIVEDQVTYPITTTMLSVAKTRVVRGYSFFGYSFVYVIFEDGTDVYWARSRVLEYLSYVSSQLPEGVVPTLGPDATPVGWVYEYALVDRSGKNDLAQLRSIQDWYLRYSLQTVPGVAEVASLGGFVKQYQIVVDPNKLMGLGVPIERVISAIRESNNDVGGRVVELAGTEFMIYGIGYIRSIEDVERIPVGVDNQGTPILVRDVARVQIGPDMRRGLAELNGEGETVGGIVEMRYGYNALELIARVKERLEQLKSGLPEGVEIVPVYDRSALIGRSIATLRGKLIEESIVVALVCVLFLLHFRSAFVAILALPLGVIAAFTVMSLQGISANIMSMGGIAIAIGAMVDGAIVMIENAHKHLERDRGKKPHWEIISDSAKEVGPALFFSLLIITFSFIPVFSLSGQSGRMFKPLAFTKTYSMAAAALLSVTIVPILMGFLIRGRIVSEAKHPISRALIWAYRPVLRLALHWRWAVIIIAVVGLAATWYPYSHLGSEFIPPLNEGDLLYMPSLLPGISIGQVRDILQRSDRILYQFPEVESVFGKAGRAESALDPAPLTMIETVIRLKPREEWRPGLTTESLIAEMNAALDFPGVTNAFTMPIKTRIDMLSTGIKTPVGIKLLGADLQVLQQLGSKVEAIVSTIPGTRSVYAERVVGGNYVDVKIDRAAAARYGLTVGAIENVIETAIGGRRVTTTVEGLERYPVNVRYARELRSDLPSLRRTLISTPTGTQVPLEQVADLSLRKGPPSIKTEGAQPTAWIYVDIDDDQDVGSYVDRAKEMLDQSFELPTGYSLVWSGQYEYMLEARARLRIAVPLTLIVILLLLYMNFGNISESLIVILTVPFAVIGGVWLIYFLGYNISVGVMVGFIALAGVAAEIGVVMIIYLDHEYKAKREELGARMTRENLRETVVAGAVERVRPVMMTVTAIMAGLLPIMWGNETGASVMKRIAAPMIGGMATATALSLLLIPIVYEMWRGRAIEHQAKLRAKNH